MRISLFHSRLDTQHTHGSICCLIIELCSNNKTSCLVLKLSFVLFRVTPNKSCALCFARACVRVSERAVRAVAWPLSLRYKRTAGGHKQSEIYLFGAGERRQRPAVLLRAGDEGYSESVMFWNASKSGLERLTTIEILTTSTAMLEFENLTPAAEKKAEKLHLRLRMRHTGLLLSPVSLSLSLSLSRTRSISC